MQEHAGFSVNKTIDIIRGKEEGCSLFYFSCRIVPGSFNIFFERKTGKGHVNSQGILKGQKSALENSLLLCLKVLICF